MIKGKIVALRSVEKEDLDHLKKWRNIQVFRKLREVRELSNEDQIEWLESLQKTKLTNYMFSIINLKDNKIIGACGLLYINWVIRSADFSFYIGEKNEYISNSDISMESVKLLIDYGFKNLNLNKIWMELYEFDNLKIDFIKNFDFKRSVFIKRKLL